MLSDPYMYFFELSPGILLKTGTQLLLSYLKRIVFLLFYSFFTKFELNYNII